MPSLHAPKKYQSHRVLCFTLDLIKDLQYFFESKYYSEFNQSMWTKIIEMNH